MKRRTFLHSAGLLVLSTPIIAGKSAPTASQAEGPFYPTTPIPLNSNLLRQRSAENISLQLSGQVLNRNNKPLANIRVEIWQCDNRGIYNHPSAPNHQQFDHQHFTGAGAALTNAQGYYQFNTLVPVPYAGRPPHIHVKLWQRDRERLTTQLYLQGQTGSMLRWFAAEREQLQIELQPTPKNSGYSARFHFIV